MKFFGFPLLLRSLSLFLLISCAGTSDEPADASGPVPPRQLLRPAPLDAAPRLAFTGARPRNLLIISVDTLRRDAVGRYGGRDDTPFLDARLAEGVALDDFQSCANSTPMAFICLNSGQAPYDWKFDLHDELEGISGLPADFTWLSARLRQLGFRAGTVTASPLMANDIQGYMASFDEAVHTERDAPFVTDDALKMADDYERETRPWMLQFHYMDPHAPYDPHEDVLKPLLAGLPAPDPSWTFGNQWLRQLHLEWGGMSASAQADLHAHAEARYRALVRTVDTELARLWAGLEERGLLEHTLVLFWSDHGEQLGERGRWTHGMNVNQEELGAMAGFWARRVSPGSVTGPTDVTDLLPTILTALGLTGAAAADEGVAQSSGYVLGTAPATRLRAVPWEGEGGRRLFSLRSGPHALVYDGEGTAEYYDMSADMAQLQDRFSPDAPEVKALWSTFRQVLPVLVDASVNATLAPPPGLPAP